MNKEVSKLFLLVDQGNLQELKKLVEETKLKKRKRDSILNSVNEDGFSVLHQAAIRNRPVIIKWLLSSEEGGGRAAGFSMVIATTDTGSTAMHVAAMNGNLECCQALVEGSNIEDGERAELLNAVIGGGCCVLHLAAARGHPSIVTWLLSSQKGGGRAAGFTNVLARVDNGMTALHLAAMRGQLECCQALVEGCNIENGERAELLNAVDQYGGTALHVAASEGHPSVIRWLLSSSEGGGRAAGFNNLLAKTSEGQTAFHYAALSGYLECFQALVECAKVDDGERAELLNAVDGNGWSPLHFAAQEGRPTIIQWLLSSCEGGGRAAGFTNVLATTNKGMTVMHIACANGHLECCQALVQGIKNEERVQLLNAVEEEGETVLHLAASEGHALIIRWLLSSEEGGGRAAGFTSASITAKTFDSLSALHLVVENETFEAPHALLSGCTMGERLTLFLSVDEHGWTPLYVAVRFHRADIIRELLLHHPEMQTIVDARDHRGMTALHRALIGGIDEESKREWQLVEGEEDDEEIGDPEVVEALLIAPKKQDKDDKTAEEQQQTEMEDDDEDKLSQQQEQPQQAAMIDPNLGIKFE